MHSSRIGAVVCAVVLAAGCNVDPRWSSRIVPVNPVAFQEHRSAEGVELAVAHAQEVDLVETVVHHRRAYIQNLQRLHEYYVRAGHQMKSDWARQELDGLRGIKRFRYLMDAEVPAGSLSGDQSIAEADAMFEEGLALMQSGGHGVPAIFRKDRMVEAAEVFRRLIEKYPQSDKIDDAAFYCGEIHKDYLPGQDLIAVQWYERAWTWNPDTPHPARFQAAVVYDYRLHDRDRALELYQQVVSDPKADANNARFAARRIRELTGMADAGR